MIDRLLHQYRDEKDWLVKVQTMALIHNLSVIKDKSWVLNDTARLMEVSIGLVSENLKIARAISEDEQFMRKCKSRIDALSKLA